MSTIPELTFDWSQPCGEFPEDNMGRAGHARNLTRFLIQKGLEGSYVLNLNAKWGTGKSYFLRRWVNEIQNDYPAVYIDAWSSDHSADPLLSVVAEINSTLRALHDISSFETALFKGVAKAAKTAVPSVVKALLKGQLKKWTGIAGEELADLISADDLADTGAKLVEEAVAAHIEASAGVKDIEKSIRQWLDSVVSSGKRQFPLFIFIDELDRCRPTYAIEMLETIKHIFDMKNVVFVVATDKEQLQHSIRAIYGDDFDSRLYLDRFFTRTVTLSNPSRTDYIARKLSDSETFSTFVQDDKNFAFLASDKGRQHDLNTLLAGIADGFGWPLRTVNLWIDRLEAALIISPRRLDIILLSFMMALETDNTDWLTTYPENPNNFEVIKFNAPMIATPWSFTQHQEELAGIGFTAFDYSVSKRHVPEINLLGFAIDRLTWLKYANKDTNTFSEIIEGYRGFIGTGDIIIYSGLPAQYGDPYHKMAMDIYAHFHNRNGTTLSNYIEICRYSSLMS